MEKVAGKPAISVTKNGVGFSKQVLSRLGYSHFVLLYINKVEKQLAIKACDKETPGAMHFIPESKEKSDSLRWNNPTFKENIKSLVSKELSDENFVCDGEYIEEDVALLFDFTKARRLDK
jgi:hypothetical protein